MKSIVRKLLVTGAVVASTFAFAQADKIVMGVSIPAATHGWAGGVVYWANRTQAELEKQYPGIKVVVKTAGSAAEQANQIQDLQTVNKINTLVIITMIILGGILWGAAGMILFIPFTSIAKLISDRTESLKTLSILLGEKEK